MDGRSSSRASRHSGASSPGPSASASPVPRSHRYNPIRSPVTTSRTRARRKAEDNLSDDDDDDAAFAPPVDT